MIDCHLMLRAGPSAARLLVVTFVTLSIVRVPLVPVVTVASTVPVHRTRSVRLTAASMATVPPNEVDAEIEPVAAVWISPRVRVAVMSMVSNDALDSLVRLFWSLAVVRAVSCCSRGSRRESKAVDSMMRATHCSMRRENVGLAPSDLGGCQAVGVASAVAEVLSLIASGAWSMNILSRDILVVQTDDVSMVAAHVSLLVLV